MGKTTKKPTTTLEWAKEYIDRGLPVLPCFRTKSGGDCSCPAQGTCKSPGKHPVSKLVPRGAGDASTDITKIRAWFAKDREYNIAVATGRNSHGWLTVVDLDITKGKDGPKVHEALLLAENKPLATTLSQTTGSGGKQYFWWSKSEVKNNVETKLGAGIDIRGTGGYVVVPPSTNKNGTYKWDKWGPPELILSMPDWYEQRCAKGASARAKVPTVATAPALEHHDDPSDKLTALQVRELLSKIPASLREIWLTFGCTIKTISAWIGGEEAAFCIWDEWAKTGDGYGGAEDQRRQWHSFQERTHHPIALLRKHAAENGWTPSVEFKREAQRWRAEEVRKMLEVLPPTAMSEELTPLLALIARLSSIDQDAIFRDIKAKTKNRIGVASMRKEVTALQLVSPPDQNDYGVVVADRVKVKHFGKGRLLIRCIDKAFWRYNGWYWECVKNDDEIRKLCVEETLQLGACKATVNSVSQQALDLLEAMQALPGDPLHLTQPPPPVVNCRNGELWIKDDFTLELRSHAPESYLRYGIDVDYDVSAKCPRFYKALREIFQDSTDPDDMCRHFVEVMGYAIQPRRHYKLYLILYGRGNNGKSKLVEVLTALVTEDCVHAGRIGKLEGSEYLIAHLCNKLLFIDDDVDSNTVLPDGILKKISESKLIQGRDPYGKPREFRVGVVPMLLANNYPYSKDLSRGTQVRAHVIPFAHEFKEGGDLDRKLFGEIIATELPGILNAAIEGLQRLEKRGGFKEPADCIKAKAEFMAGANPLLAFIEQRCQTLEQALERIDFMLDLDLCAASQRSESYKENLRQEAKIEKAKLAKDGIEQSSQDFYDTFIRWCGTEGINWKPRKSDVERDLVHSGFYVGPGKYQKTIRGLRAADVL